jgi:uncharacterized protein (TIGR02996 family)
MRDVFERAIRENPDDPAGYAAYADWLHRQGDPRGEFIQVQTALEDETLASDRRKELKSREEALFSKHKAEWVGEWAEYPNIGRRENVWKAPDPSWVPYRFARGLLTAVEIGHLTVNLARQLVRAPQLSFVRELTVHGIAHEWKRQFEEGPDTAGRDRGHPAQYVLVKWPQLRHLRAFRFGGPEPFDYDSDCCPYNCHTPGDLAADFAEQMPEVEQLHFMAHVREEAHRLVALPMYRLRALLLYHGWNYPLDRLADNPSLTNLRELCCHPHATEWKGRRMEGPYIRRPHLRAVCQSKYLMALTHLQLRLADFGDEGIDEIVRSGLLKRLRVLDLRHGTVTDAGARALAACPDLKHLDHLDLSWNRLTPAGVAALVATGVRAALNRQQGANTDDWETFGHGDIE